MKLKKGDLVEFLYLDRMVTPMMKEGLSNPGVVLDVYRAEFGEAATVEFDKVEWYFYTRALRKIEMNE